VNNNAETNGGYNFVSYKWFKNGEVVGNMQYYSAGKNVTDHLDANAGYMVEVMTDKGEVLHTCEAKPVLENFQSFVLYPNPVKAGELITVDTGSEEVRNGELYVYSISGTLVYRQEVKGAISTFRLNKPGTYVLKLAMNDNQRQSSTIIVNE
jgi:hypothetical protein